MIYVKTKLGQQVIQNRSVPLTPRQRAAFIMFDGRRDSTEVLKATAGMGVTVGDLKRLVSLGLLLPNTSAPDDLVARFLPTEPAQSFQEVILLDSAAGSSNPSAQAHYERAYLIAMRLTAELGLRGFRLNLSVGASPDLDKLKELAPKIKEAVGPEKFIEFENALYY